MVEHAEQNEALEGANSKTLLRRYRWPIFGLAAIILILVAGLLLDSKAGHEWLAGRVNAMRPESGLRINIGSIDGSIYSEASVKKLKLSDKQGVFFEAGEARVNWNPVAWIFNELNISSLIILSGNFRRIPALKASTEDTPILPGFDVYLGAFTANDMHIGSAIAGQVLVANLTGSADIRAGRAMILIDGTTDKSADRIEFSLNAEPDEDRFDLKADILMPKNGVLGAMAGFENAASLKIEGEGGWKNWTGNLVASSNEKRSAILALSAKGGEYKAEGDIYSGEWSSGLLGRLITSKAKLEMTAGLEDRMASIDASIVSPAIALSAKGGLDFGDNRFSNVKLNAQLSQPSALLKIMSARGLKGEADLDGEFNAAKFDYRLSADKLGFGPVIFARANASGNGNLQDGAATMATQFDAQQVTGVGEGAEPLFRTVKATASLLYKSGRLSAEKGDFQTNRIKSKVGFFVDIFTGDYDVEIGAKLPEYLISGLGVTDLSTKLRVKPDRAGYASLSGSADAQMTKIENGFLESLGGGLPHATSDISLGPNSELKFSNLALTAPALKLLGGGVRKSDGTVEIQASGTHDQYGPVDVSLSGNLARPEIKLALASPFPAAGLNDVTLNLLPDENGFMAEARGGSTLGPFNANAAILLPEDGAASIAIKTLKVSRTIASGVLKPVAGGLIGALKLNGGGVDGNVSLSQEDGKQKITTNLLLKNARFDGPQNIYVRSGNAKIMAVLEDGHSNIDASMLVRGIRAGETVLGRIALQAKLRDGTGSATASLAGTRGSKFEMQTKIDLKPDQYSIIGQGSFKRRKIDIAGPAIVRRTANGWQLLPTKIEIGKGAVDLQGRFGTGATSLNVSMNKVPLVVADIGFPKAGLGGFASGNIDYNDSLNSPPTGNAKITVKGLTRSGLVLSSVPVDLGLNAALTDKKLALRGVIQNKGKTTGRFQARVSSMASVGSLAERISNAPLFAQLRFNGRADTLWRLTGVELIDVTGPVGLAADVKGSLKNPFIQGSVRTDKAKVESHLTGTVVSNVRTRGRFDGSKLVLSSLSGETSGGGTISGQGSFDISLSEKLGIDLTLNSKNALLIERDDFGARMSGPLRIKSNNVSGTISGKLRISESRFKLGQAAASAALPNIKTVEINRILDDAPLQDIRPPWQLNVEANMPKNLKVNGLGLSSEWAADLAITGAVDKPRLLGEARMLRGNYDFAGRRFRLERGNIRFRGAYPPNPVLDIQAEAGLSDLNAIINIRGTGTRPEVAFSSTPSLPQDELLSRLLFGTSIQKLSAPEALQLASAVASLQSGGGLDPINAVRKAAGLDRLRILPADISTGRGTSLAAGKYLTRRAYVEVVTDGKGYSATQVEFQITRWLSLLSTISTIGRQSGNIKVSRDY